MTTLTRTEAFDVYESARGRLPPVRRNGRARRVSTIEDLADGFDVFLLDAFGVLNVGDAAIPGTAERIDWLRARGKRVLVLTNAAGRPDDVLQGKYAGLGFDFDARDIVSSRAVLFETLKAAPSRRWGVIAAGDASSQRLDPDCMAMLGDDPAAYAAVDGFLFLGSAEWTEARQRLLQSALLAQPRPVWVGNPDVVAPRVGGFSVEPGYYAHRLADAAAGTPRFIGKPFGEIFETALSRLDGASDRSRVIMVGDTLHTDVLGAQTAGVASALVADFGFFAGASVDDAIAQSGIAPDFVIGRP